MTPRTAEACGTDRGYQIHRRAGTQACADCLAARRRYIADYRRRTRRTVSTLLTDMEQWHLTGKSGDFL